MAEPSEERLEKLVGIFLTKYNSKHKTNFQWKSGKSYVANESQTPWADAIVFDKKQHLYIQHKEVVWDQAHHKVRASYASKLMDYIIDYLQRQGQNEFTIHVNIYPDKIPTLPKDMHRLAFDLSNLIKLRDRKKFSTRQPLFSYDEYDDIYLERLKKVFSYIYVFASPGYKTPGFGFGWSTKEIRALPHYGDVVTMFIEKKATNDRDIILLLDATTLVDDYDLSLIKEGLKNDPINQEVWIVEDFIGKEKATQLN